ncbi:Transthyretin, partial [Conidiobolus coronatus NRRL 28638]
MAARGPITTHILDLETGLPGKGVFCKLVRRKDRDLKNTNVDVESNEWETLNVVQTNDDGRADFLKGIESSPLAFGYYYIEFGVQSYFAQQNRQAFYPKVV